MISLKRISLFSITALHFSSCTLFIKEIKVPVTVALPQRTSNVYIQSWASETRYTHKLIQDSVSAHFLKSLTEQGKIIKNITITDDTNKSDFIIKVISLNIHETSTTHTIDNPQSSFHGKEVVINSVACSAEVEIIDTKNKSAKLRNCYDSKTRTEKLKNNRDFADLVLDQNKDNTVYRTKPLRENISMDLTGDVGSRLWVPISRTIAKTRKE